jgi:phosphatidylglycerol:prolipoprotein diacylglycerol transferase
VHPILLDFGTHDLPLLGETHLFLPTYGVLFALATLLAWGWFLRRARALPIEPERAFNLTFYSLLAGLLGAKATLILVEWRHYLANPADLLASLRSAGVLLGGVLAGALVFVLYARRQRLPLLALGDAIAAPLALAQSVGRLGCTAAGCCWGVQLQDHPWWALVFRDPVAADQTGVPLQVPLFPSQPAQALNDLAIAGILTWLWRRRGKDGLPEGAVFWWYLVLYGVTRGLLEHWRGDTARGLWFGGHVSTSQVLSALAALFGFAMLVRGMVRRRREVRTG